LVTYFNLFNWWFCKQRIGLLYNKLIIDVQNEQNDEYPSELQSFLAKQWLFKVEVGDGNTIFNWRCFSVKKDY